MIRFCGWNLLLAGQRGQEGITVKRKTGGDANGAGGIKRISAETLELLALDFLKKVAKKAVKFQISRLFVVDSKGFEPSTSRMRTERSRKVVSFLPTDCGVWFDENAGRGAAGRNTIPQFFNKARVDSKLICGKE